MKVKYYKSKGNRIKKGSLKITNRKYRVNNFEGLGMTGNHDNCWWCEDLNKWITLENSNNKYDLSDVNIHIKNLKQAIRHIKHHPEIEKGTIMCLRSNFIGYHIDIIV